MTAAKKYLNILKEREPERWQGPLTESALTEQDLSEIEKGLGYTLPIPVSYTHLTLPTKRLV